MQIQHKGYFDVTKGKSIVKKFFNDLGYDESVDLKGDNPLNIEERLDVIVGEGFYNVEFRNDNIQIDDRCPDVDTVKLENQLQQLGENGILIALVFEKLTKLANYEYVGIRQQDENLIIINFKKDDLRGYLNLQKSEHLIALTYTPLSTDHQETFEEKGIKQNLDLTTSEVNDILNTN